MTPEERSRIHCDHNQETYCQLCLKDVVLRAERTHPAPELREVLEAAYVENQNMHCFETKGKLNEALNAQTKILRAALSLPGLEAVECYTCFLIRTGLLDHLDPCPQRCDKGRVWVRMEKV